MILLFAVITLSMVLALTFILYKNQKPRKVPPGPPGLPLIGNLYQFMIRSTSNLHIFLWKLSKIYGPLMHIKLGSTSTLIVSSARLAKEVLKTHDSSFCSRPGSLAQQKLSYGCCDVAFSPYGDHWREVRKTAIIHLFSLQKTQLLRPIREEEVARMIRRISDSTSLGRAVDLSEIATDLYFMLICRIASSKSYEDGGPKMRRLARAFLEAMDMLGSMFVCDFFPPLRWVDRLLGSVGRLEKMFAELDAFYEELIESKREKKSDDEERKDILDILIQLIKDGSSSIPFTWNYIKALLMDIFVPGTDTNTTTIIWTMMSLMKAPTIMRKLQQEIRETVKNKG